YCSYAVSILSPSWSLSLDDSSFSFCWDSPPSSGIFSKAALRSCSSRSRLSFSCRFFSSSRDSRSANANSGSFSAASSKPNASPPSVPAAPTPRPAPSPPRIGVACSSSLSRFGPGGMMARCEPSPPLTFSTNASNFLVVSES
ncbi:hypothetical protein T310_8762, partial [Rasamsonia emersonii CBS 393.64]